MTNQITQQIVDEFEKLPRFQKNIHGINEYKEEIYVLLDESFLLHALSTHTRLALQELLENAPEDIIPAELPHHSPHITAVNETNKKWREFLQTKIKEYATITP